jgi:hypothetical protein
VTLNRAAKAALFASQTGEAFLTLLTLKDKDGNVLARVVNDMVDHESRGPTFTAFPFVVVLPADRADQVNLAQLRIDNIDRNIAVQLRQATGALTVMIEMVLASDPDTVQAGPMTFKWRIASWDVFTAVGDLHTSDMLVNEVYPGDKLLPAYFPAAF